MLGKHVVKLFIKKKLSVIGTSRSNPKIKKKISVGKIRLE